jgi:hypothetical protein
MKKLFIVMVLGFLALASYSQDGGGDYRGAIGARIGTSFYDVLSVSYKTFLSNAGAIELNGGFGIRGYSGYYGGGYYDDRPFSLSASASYQHHFNIPVQGLRWFVGGGLTVANSFSDNDQLKEFNFGLFPTGGVDYKIPRIPLNVSADIRPTFFLTNPNIYNDVVASFGVSARYTFR